MHKWYNIRFEFVVTIAPGGSVGGVDFYLFTVVENNKNANQIEFYGSK